MTGPAQYEDLVADRVMNKNSEVGGTDRLREQRDD
jgi:hypothetical protein